VIAIYDKTLAAACKAENFNGKYLLWGKKLEDILGVANSISGKRLIIKTTAEHKSKVTGVTTILSRELVGSNGEPYAIEDNF
jgi:hypothetical protein